ncbi:MAG: hypothetical protein JWN23_1526 [Rhodocyclales bacterium]|nr:hypothetical protein [Rhodocyclales bacterium]
MKHPPRSPGKQKGVTLIVSMIMLLVLLLLGISASQSGGLQEKMAGGTRNREIAFEAAETALGIAQATLVANYLAAEHTYTNSTGTATLVGPANEHANDASFWNGVSWVAATCAAAGCHTVPAGKLTKVAAQPMYYVERLADIGSPTPHQTYRITARGFGGTSDTVVIVQSIYRL